MADETFPELETAYRRREYRGQIWSIDFIVGAIALTFVLLIFALIWNDLAIRWNSSSDYRHMQTDALFAADALMTTSGEPDSWESIGQINGSDISAIGLVNGRNVLNPVKLDTLSAQNSSAYGFVKKRLGLSRYEMGLNVTDMEREESYYLFGRFPGGLNESIVYERLGLLNGTPVIVRVVVWR